MAAIVKDDRETSAPSGERHEQGRRRDHEGPHEAHAVVKGEKQPSSAVAVGGDVRNPLAFLEFIFEAALRAGRQADVQIRVEFLPTPKAKKEKRANGRKR